MLKLTDKQWQALEAVADPGSIHGQLFWAQARARWPGPRKTLGSLEHRGLVSYNPDGWKLTETGRVVIRRRTLRAPRKPKN